MSYRDIRHEFLDEIDDRYQKLTPRQQELIDGYRDVDFEYLAELDDYYWDIGIPIHGRKFGHSTDLSEAFLMAQDGLDMHMVENMKQWIQTYTPRPHGLANNPPYCQFFIHKRKNKYHVFAPLLGMYYIKAEGYTLQQAYDELERIISELPGVLKKQDITAYYE